MDTGICYIIDENGYIMFISQPEGTDRIVSDKIMNQILINQLFLFLGGYWKIYRRIRRSTYE